MKKLLFSALVALLGALFSSPVGASQLLNISTRAAVFSGDLVLIGGIIIDGTEPKKVILRGIGPSIPATDFAPHLSDPVLELHQADGTVTENDDWRETQEAEITATTLPPPDDAESAIVVTLPPGAHTVILHGKGEDAGLGLVECYDLDQAADSTLANISTRGFVGVMDSVMIGGIIVGPEGSGDSTVIVRGLGPSLADFGVDMPLPDPVLTVFNSDGDIIGGNDNWMDDPNATAIAAAGLAPPNDLEAAFQASFAPGAYTAILIGTGSDIDSVIGVGLVEAYHIQ